MKQKSSIFIVLGVLFLFCVLVYVFLKGQSAEAPSLADVTETETAAKESDEGEIDIVNALDAFSNEISFAHVVPGEYSEVYFLLRGGQPGQTKLVTLEGPGVVSDNDQIATFDEKGEARFVWRINRYGAYSVYEDVYDEVMQVDTPMLIKSVTVN